jgi:hypothetical protein
MKRDLQQHHHQTVIQLILGGVLLLLIIGDGAIYLIYGEGAALMGLLCIGSAFVPIGITYLLLLVIACLVKHIHKGD